MKLFCAICARFTDHICHCDGCDKPLTVGDEAYKTADGRVYCPECCELYELQEPEPMGDWE